MTIEEADERPLEYSDLARLQSFLLRQEYNGRYFTNAMNAGRETEIRDER